MTAVVAIPTSPAGRPAATSDDTSPGWKEAVMASLGEAEDLIELLEATGTRGQELEVLEDGRFLVRWS